MQKRLANEKKRWTSQWIISPDYLIHIPINLPYLHGILQINPVPNYPFKPPTLSYNGQSIYRIYRTGSLFQEDMKLITGMKCLCCGTFLCPDNWHCTVTIADIVEEFLKVIDYKFRIVERFLCKKIQEKYLHNVPIHEYL